MLRELVYLLDILQSAERIQAFTEGMSQDTFDADIKTQDAVIRRLEIIGEAVRRLSVDFRVQHPDIPWPQIAGMRSKLIHSLTCHCPQNRSERNPLPAPRTVLGQTTATAAPPPLNEQVTKPPIEVYTKQSLYQPVSTQPFVAEASLPL